MAGIFEHAVGIALAALGVYAALGCLFALLFVTRGVHQVDTQARNAPLGFRVIILPGVIAFWPLLMRRWIGGNPEPPVERSPHR
jgi:hypothetical protein